MTGKAALAKALLEGKTVSIKTAFKDFGISNAPREISRAIEQPFGVSVERTKKEGKTKYGVHCIWFEYKLLHKEENLEGIKLMLEYVKKEQGVITTDVQQKSLDKITDKVKTISQQKLLL